MSPIQYPFARSRRLRGDDFAAVFAARQRQSRGVVTLHVLPNGLAYNRLGISIGRRHGNAARRNLIKRRLREAFRLHQPTWAQGYDLAVTLKVHSPLSVQAYAAALEALLSQGVAAWQRRQGNEGPQRQAKSSTDTEADPGTAPPGEESPGEESPGAKPPGVT